MISLQGIVMFILLLLGAAFVFGMLAYLINYCRAKFPNANPIFFNVADVAIVIFAVLFLIGVVISLVSGQPLFRNDLQWRTVP